MPTALNKEKLGIRKAWLQSRNQWDAFKSRREQLKGEGLPWSKMNGVLISEFELNPDGTAPEEVNIDESKIPAPLPPAPPPAPAPEPILQKTRKQTQEEDPASWSEMKKVDVVADAKWVYQNLGRSGVKKEDCPNAGAWAWLQLVSQSDGALQRFFSDTVGKLMPSQKMLEQMERMSDDGSAVLELIDKVLDAHEKKKIEEPYEAEVGTRTGSHDDLTEYHPPLETNGETIATFPQKIARGEA